MRCESLKADRPPRNLRTASTCSSQLPSCLSPRPERPADCVGRRSSRAASMLRRATRRRRRSPQRRGPSRLGGSAWGGRSCRGGNTAFLRLRQGIQCCCYMLLWFCLLNLVSLLVGILESNLIPLFLVVWVSRYRFLLDHCDVDFFLRRDLPFGPSLPRSCTSTIFFFCEHIVGVGRDIFWTAMLFLDAYDTPYRRAQPFGFLNGQYSACSTLGKFTTQGFSIKSFTCWTTPPFNRLTTLPGSLDMPHHADPPTPTKVDDLQNRLEDWGSVPPKQRTLPSERHRITASPPHKCDVRSDLASCY